MALLGRLLSILVLVGAGCSSPTPPPPPPPPPSLLVLAPANYLPGSVLTGRSMEARAADFDGDGDLDLIVAREHAPNILLLNDGTGRFLDASNRIPQKVRDSEDIVVADFDGDGDLDIVIVSEDETQGTQNAPKHEYYIGDGAASFSDASGLIPVRGDCNAVASGDIDGDGDLDLVFGCAGPEIVLINVGGGDFRDESASRIPGQANDATQDVVLAELDGDGDLDLAVANESGGPNRILFNNGRGVFTPAPEGHLPPRSLPEATRNADLADVDGDADLDLFFSNVTFAGGAPGSRLLRNDGTGRFTDVTATHLPSMNYGVIDGDFADIDGDGDRDLILAPLPTGPYRAFLNDGQGRFADETSKVLPPGLTGQGLEVEIADYDRDGRLDVYLANFAESPDMLLLSKK